MDTFNQVQRQLKAGNKPSYGKPEIAFAHLITCGHCGCSVIGDSKQQGRYIYYRCTHFKQKCPDKYIREEKLTEQFEAMVRSFTVTEEQYQWMVAGLKDINAMKDQELADRREFLNAEIQRISNRLSQLYEDKLDGVIDSAFYQKKATEGQERLQDLQANLERLQEASKKQMELGLLILEFAKDAYPLFSFVSHPEKARLLKIVLLKCCLKDGILTPTYKKPFDVLVEGAKYNYPQGNSKRRSRVYRPLPTPPKT
jgi:hypothetical protein